MKRLWLQLRQKRRLFWSLIVLIMVIIFWSFPIISSKRPRLVIKPWSHESVGDVASFSFDGRSIITMRSGNSQEFQFWDASNGEELPIRFMATHISYSSDRRTMVIANGGTLQEWDASGIIEMATDSGGTTTTQTKERFGIVATGANAWEAAVPILWRASSDKLPRYEIAIIPSSEISDPLCRYVGGGTASRSHINFEVTITDLGEDEVLDNRVFPGVSRCPPNMIGSGSATVPPSMPSLIEFVPWLFATMKNTNLPDPIQVIRNRGILESLSYSPSGQTLATVVFGEGIVIWDVMAGRELYRIEAPIGSGWGGIGYSPDGHFIVSWRFWSNAAFVFDVETGNNSLQLIGHTDEVLSASYSPDGRFIVTASRDQTARVWDSTTGEELVKLTGHEGGVMSASYSPDERFVVTGGRDKTARVWDSITGEELAKLTRHPSHLRNVGYSPDGSMVITLSGNEIRVYDFSDLVNTSGRR